MLRATLVLALSLTASTAWAAPAYAAEDGMTPAIAQCLRDNAAKVESAEPDLTKATDYLVGNACALPVALEQKRLNDLRIQAQQQHNLQQCEDRVAQQKKYDAANTAQNGSSHVISRVYENCALQSNNFLSTFNFLSVSGIGPKPAAAVSMAAKLILDLRVAHNKARP
jgi:hypothetical protein